LLANGSFWVANHTTGSVNERGFRVALRARPPVQRGPYSGEFRALSDAVRQLPGAVRQESGTRSGLPQHYVINGLIIFIKRSVKEKGQK
jgi:hypothetical protein